MKSVLFAVLAVVLAGCSTAWPENASINPQINDQPDNLLAGQSVSVSSQDVRSGHQIIKINKQGEPVVLIPNAISPDQVMADRLQKGLAAQGATIAPQGGAEVKVIVQNMLAEVTKPGLAYKTRVRMEVKLQVQKNGAGIAKTYQKSAMKESATQPDMGDIELMLNDQTSKLLNDMLSDSQVRAVIKGSNY